MSRQKRNGTIRTSVFAVAAVIAAMLPVVLTATPASAATLNVTYTLEGCNLDHGGTINTVTHICSDSAYTTGNLGKSWAELDKVPMRVTLKNGGGTSQAGTFTVAGDYRNTALTAIGWDHISTLSPKAGSPAACSSAITNQGAETITASGDGVGGADQTIYRKITATIPANTTCVYDYTMRLALGAHNFSGSSLQANLWSETLDSGTVGEKRVSIPVNEIAPQQFGKVMTASRGSSVVWSIEKNSDTSNVSFTNTCDVNSSRVSGDINVTISWSKITTQSDLTTIVTTYTLTNPAHLAVVATVNDTIYPGTDQSQTPIATITPLTFNLDPGETESQSVTTTTTDTSTHFNDQATASYTIDNEAAGSLDANADADVEVLDPSSGASATISDTESITPDNVGIGFRVTAVSGASGTFSPAYVPGANASVVTSLGWSSTQSDSGSVTFTKRIVIGPGAFQANATLSDTATVSPDGQTATSAGPVNTTISVSAVVSLTINKSIPNILTGSETASFDFQVSPGATFDSNNVVATKTISFSAGQTSNSATVTGLDPGQYAIHEVPVTKWQTQPDQTKTINLPSCSGSVTFVNDFGPATAQVQKVTVPASATEEAGWTFTLNGPGAGSGITAITTGAGYVTFNVNSDPNGSAFSLQQGSYTITETAKPGYDQTGSSSECSFTVDYPANAGHVYQCTFTNTKRGTVTVVKTENGSAPTVQYSFRLSGGPDNVSITKTTGVDDSPLGSGNLSFGLLKPGTYTLCELMVPAGTTSTLQSYPGATINTTTGDVCVTFTLAAGGTQAFSIDNQHPLGGQRTIGYWKNWNRCAGSSGNQVKNAAKTGHALMDDLLPISLGNYVVDTCARGVAVLNNASSKYAENGLAAQLLGAKLNVKVAGGTACIGALSAISSADSLLKTINYAGPPSAIIGNNSQYRSQAVSLTSTLDKFNNEKLC